MEVYETATLSYLVGQPNRSQTAVRNLLQLSKSNICQVLLNYECHAYVFRNPVQTEKILKLTNRELFTGLIERHGRSDCLDDAVECLWSYVQQCLVPENAVAHWKKPVELYLR